MYDKSFKRALSFMAVLTLAAGSVLTGRQMWVPQGQAQWKIHDMSRPAPSVVIPATAGTQDRAGQAPSDAIVLFDGKDLSQWRSKNGGPARWVVKNGYIAAVKGSGYIRTVQNFGDCQVHLEWAAPLPVKGEGQERGNSGVFLMGKYEVQILDSYNNRTYCDGQAGAVYGQYPPQVNAGLPPGEWQSFDIVFHRPYFDSEGQLVRAGTMTVLHNGVLVQDNVEIKGPTDWLKVPSYKAHPDKLPLLLQDHANPVRFRNIWIRELPAGPAEAAVLLAHKEVTLASELLDSYVGRYKDNRGRITTIYKKDHHLAANLFDHAEHEVFAGSQNVFFTKLVDVQISFEKDNSGKVKGLTIHVGGSKIPAKKINGGN